MAECQACHADCLHKLCARKIPVFSSLNPAELEHLSAIARHRQYPKGGILTRDGETLDSLVILNEGSAKAFKLTPEGREQILYVFSQGDFFGERNLLGSGRMSYTVEALEPLKTCSFSRGDFHGLLQTNPDIAIKIMEELESRIERMERALQTMGVRNLDSRIGSLLLEFSEKYGESVPEGVLIRLPLSREGLANFLGIARETFSRKLNRLETQGVIRSAGQKSILVLDQEALRTAAGA